MKRRWHKRKAPAHHADDWLMTYADMITLLLCFFAVFLAVSIPKKDIPQKTETPPVVQPAPPMIEQAKPIFLSENGLPLHDLAQDEPDDTPEPAPLMRQAEVSNEAPVAPPAPSPVADQPPTALPELVDHAKTLGNAEIEQKGNRITTMQMNSEAFFGSGSAVLSESGKGILRSVAIKLKSDAYKGYQVTVEGHTDDQPIDTMQFPSNWELSTARAAAVARFFLEQGLPPARLRAAGYADTFPVAPNRDASGNPIPENQARNRRVVITLERIEKGE